MIGSESDESGAEGQDDLSSLPIPDIVEAGEIDDMGHIPDFAGSEYGTLVEQSGVGNAPELRAADAHADNLEQRLGLSGEVEVDLADFDLSGLDVEPVPDEPLVTSPGVDTPPVVPASDELDELLR